KAKHSAPSEELGFLARLWRTPWFLPAFGAASVATVVFLVRVIKNPEVLPGQRRHSIEERALATAEPVPPPEPAAAVPQAVALSPEVPAKVGDPMVAAKPAASAGGATRHTAKESAARMESPPPVIKSKKSISDDPLSGLSLGEGRSSAGAPSRFAEPPPPREGHGRDGKSVDDLMGSIAKGSNPNPRRARTEDLDNVARPSARDDELLSERKSVSTAAPAKKGPAPWPPGETNDSLSRPSGFASQPIPAASPPYAPTAPKPTNAARAASPASAPAPVSPRPTPKHEMLKLSDSVPEAAVDSDEEESSYVVTAKDKKSKADEKASPSLDETLRKAERLYASSDWNAAADAYRDLLRRFPSHKDAPRWRDRMNESIVAEQQRQAKIKKAKASSEALDGLKL
ncbi:MAG TPA: hypothetical protein VIM14_00210, partial [Polyangia bacterium]